MTLPATVTPSARLRRVDPRTEAVAGGWPRWLRGYLKGLATLPTPIDDLTTDFGADLYRRMLFDPTCAAGLRTLGLAMLSQGDHLTPAVQDEDPRAGLAQEITQFCRYVVDGLQPHRMDVYADLLSASGEGYRIAEQVYRDAEKSELQQFPGLKNRGSALLLRSLKPKSNDTLSFVCDEFLNVHGFLPTQGRYTGTTTYTDDRTKILPKERFAWLSWMPKDSDPRGTSLLRCVYTAWWHKMQAWGEYLKYLVQFASPSLMARITPGTQATEADPETGEQVRVIDAVLANLLTFQNGSAMAFRNVDELKAIEMQGNGEAHRLAMSFYDSQITYGLTGQQLAGSEAKFGTRAQARVHQDTRDLLVAYGRAVLAETLRDDMLVPLVVYNYGPEAKHLVPSYSFTRGGPEDLAAILKAHVHLEVKHVPWAADERVDVVLAAGRGAELHRHR